MDQCGFLSTKDGRCMVLPPAVVSIRHGEGLQDLKVENEGWERQPVASDAESEPETIRMRGYKIKRNATAVIQKQRDVSRLAGDADCQFFDVGDCSVM